MFVGQDLWEVFEQSNEVMLRCRDNFFKKLFVDDSEYESKKFQKDSDMN